jgi:hypothetical protein
MTPEELKAHLGELLEQSRDLEIKLKVAYRLIDDCVPKSQRVVGDGIRALEGIDKVQCALIRSRSAIQVEEASND